MLYKFGNTKVEINASHVSGKILQDEFKSLKESDTGKGELTLNITNYHDLTIPHNSIYCDGLYIKGDTYLMDSRIKGRFGDLEFAYRWKGHPYIADRLQITVYCDPRYMENYIVSVYSYIKKLLDWNYLTPVERIGKNLTYNLLEPFLNMYMLKNGQTFIHASGVVDNDCAIIFTGWGGVGKTATTLKLVLEHNFRFMADDLLIIGKGGYAYLYPKKMQIYAYNTVGFDELYRRLMANRSILDKVHWTIYKKTRGLKGVRRRVHPWDIVGAESLAPKRAKIGRIYYLYPTIGGDLTLNSIDAEKLAKHSRSIILKEMWSVYRHFNAMESVINPPITLDEIMDINQQLYSDIFSKHECKSLSIPKNTHPTRIVDAILKDL